MRSIAILARTLLFCGIVSIMFSQLSQAQVTTGSVHGTVTDKSNAAVPGAELVLTNISTNLVMQQKSDDLGQFVFNVVPPGIYTLTATSPGFNSTTINNVRVQVDNNTVTNVMLDVGAVTQNVVVSASDNSVIDTQSAVVKTDIEEELITDLPSSSRNPLVTAEMAPGITMNTSGLTGGSQMLTSNGIGANVSGSRQQENTFYLDGTDNSGAYRNLGLQVPNPEAIQEVQVVTSTNSAEFGKQPGGYFNIITKSGTNKFHGSGFYFGTNAALNANTYNANHVGLARVPANKKQYGGTLGGPIRKDKTFFFGSYQRYQDNATTLNQTIPFPTQAMEAGDFSGFQGVLYNPTTNAPIPNNNLAAAGLLDPVAVKLAAYLMPTVPTLGNLLVWQFVSPIVNNEVLGKLNHTFSDSQRLEVSTFQTWGNTQNQVGADPLTSEALATSRQDTTSVRHIWQMRPTLILQSQFSMALQQAGTSTPSNLTGKDLSSFGAVWPQSISGAPKFLPEILIAGTNLGPDNPQSSGGVLDQKNYQVGSTATWTKGAHNLTFGYQAQDSIVADIDQHDATLVRFQGEFSNQHSFVFGSTPNSQFAHSFADFMMGRIENFSTQGAVQYNFPAWSHYAFAQDQWRVTPRLTANLGVRYELAMPAQESNGRAAAFVANHQSNQFANVPLHVAFQGDSGIIPGFIRQDKKEFAPRVGLAYDLLGNNKLALRTGYGYYYSNPSDQIRTFQSTNFPVVPNVQGTFAQLDNPFATSTSPVFTTPPTPFPSYANYISSYVFTPPFSRIIGFDPNFTPPRMQQWNVSAEGQVRSGIDVTIGYVGSRGTHLLQGVPFNYGRFVTVSGQPPNSTNFQQRVLYPTMSVFSIMESTEGRSWYDALQASSKIRLSGLTARVTYVYAQSKGDGGGFGAFAAPDEDPTGFTSNTNNPENPRAEVGPNANRQTFRFFYVYDIPFFRNAKSVIGRAASGWQVAGNVEAATGSPLDVILGYDANFDAFTSAPQDRPNRVSPIHYASGSKDQKMSRYFDVPTPFAANSGSAFAAPVITSTNLFGNLPRNALWGPGTWNSDISVLKSIPLREGMKLQLRMESYDFLNHNNLDNPTTNMSNANYGKILTRTGNRTMQYSATFSF